MYIDLQFPILFMPLHLIFFKIQQSEKNFPVLKGPLCLRFEIHLWNLHTKTNSIKLSKEKLMKTKAKNQIKFLFQFRNTRNLILWKLPDIETSHV